MTEPISLNHEVLHRNDAVYKAGGFPLYILHDKWEMKIQPCASYHQFMALRKVTGHFPTRQDCLDAGWKALLEAGLVKEGP